MPYTVPEARVREVPFANNLLTNPGFEIWQRGTSFSTSAGTAPYPFCADEWNMNSNSSGMTINRNTSSLFGDYCLEFIQTAGELRVVRQGIESYKGLEGNWLTFSCWVKTSVSDFAQLALIGRDNTSNVLNERSPYHPGDGQWRLLTVLGFVPEGLIGDIQLPHNFGLAVDVRAESGSGTVYMDGAVLAVGYFPEGLMYVPPMYADDFRRCCRYYYNSVGIGERTMWSGKTNNGTSYHIDKVFPAPMYATPTITLSDAGRSSFGASTTSISPQGFWERATANATSNRGYFRSDWTAEVS